MGRPPKNRNAEPVVPAKPPMMKYGQAMRLADKNARTIMKISQLVVSSSNTLFRIIYHLCNHFHHVKDIVHQPGYAKADPKGRIGSHIGKSIIVRDLVYK